MNSSNWEGLRQYYDRDRGDELRRDIEISNRKVAQGQDQVELFTTLVRELRELRRCGEPIAVVAAAELVHVSEELNRATGKLKKDTQDLAAAQDRLNAWVALNRWSER